MGHASGARRIAADKPWPTQRAPAPGLPSPAMPRQVGGLMLRAQGSPSPQPNPSTTEWLLHVHPVPMPGPAHPGSVARPAGLDPGHRCGLSSRLLGHKLCYG